MPLASLDTLRINKLVNDDDMVALGRMTDLGSLRCRQLCVDDEGLRCMRNMTRLRSLDLTRQAITDAGMAYVGQMKGLDV